MAIALELALPAEPIDAEKALPIGHINRVVPAAELTTRICAPSTVCRVLRCRPWH